MTRFKRELVRRPLDRPRVPAVSVIVPWRNTPIRILERAVRSVGEQSYSGHINVAVCNDGSNAHTRSLAVNLFHQLADSIDVEVYMIHHYPGRGISAARNSACRSSDSEWFVWLDADDQLHPQAVSTLMDSARSANFEMVLPQCEVRSPAGVRIHRNSTYLRDWRRGVGTPDPLAQVVFPVHGALVSRELFFWIGGFDEEFAFAELTDFFLRSAVAAGRTKIGFVPRPLYRYFRSAGSHSAARQSLEEYRIRALLRYSRAVGLPYDNLCYVGRSALTGAQHYVPLILGKRIASPYGEGPFEVAAEVVDPRTGQPNCVEKSTS
jgi:glycosyltransferase involved in cell wall biosynthesis